MRLLLEHRAEVDARDAVRVILLFSTCHELLTALDVASNAMLRRGECRPGGRHCITRRSTGIKMLCSFCWIEAPTLAPKRCVMLGSLADRQVRSMVNCTHLFPPRRMKGGRPLTSARTTRCGQC